MKPSVFFYVQHLLGIGHVYRASRVARGMVRAGFDVHLVWGGTRVAEFDYAKLNVHFLEPVRSGDASFNQLLHADGRQFSEADQSSRAQQLVSLYDEISPDILITEAFPFGRRQMQFELLPLLDHAKAANTPPMIVSSIRDIMQENRKPKRVAESNALISKYFDLILVHGDEKLIRIEETLQGTETFLEKIRYTGLVTPEPRAPTGKIKYDVLVSAGGGAFGRELLDYALKAQPLLKADFKNWLVISGSEMSEADFERVRKIVPAEVTFIRQVPDLLKLMQSCRVSISHAGYNTVADIMRAGCASVLFPHVGGKESEQLRRAQLLDQHGVAVMVDPEEISPSMLAKAVKTAATSKPMMLDLNLEGAQTAAEILQKEFSGFRQ